MMFPDGAVQNLRDVSSEGKNTCVERTSWQQVQACFGVNKADKIGKKIDRANICFPNV